MVVILKLAQPRFFTAVDGLQVWMYVFRKLCRTFFRNLIKRTAQRLIRSRAAINKEGEFYWYTYDPVIEIETEPFNLNVHWTPNFNFTCNFLLILIPKKGVSANNFLLHEFLLHNSEGEGYKKVFKFLYVESRKFVQYVRVAWPSKWKAKLHVRSQRHFIP